MLRFFSPRQLIPLAIVAFWLGMMAWLAQREFFTAELPAAPNQFDRPVDTWMAVYLSGNQRVGYVHFVEYPEARARRQGTRFSLGAQLRLSVLGPTTDIDVKGSAWLPKTRGQGDVSLDVSSGSKHPFYLQAKVGNGLIDGFVRTVGHRIPLHIPTNGKVDWIHGFNTVLNASAMEVGKEYSVKSFDPVSLSMTQSHVRCVGTETITAMGKRIPTKVVQIDSGGSTTKAWVSNDDEIIRAEVPLGFVLERVTPQEALRTVSPKPATDLIMRSAIRPSGKPVKRGAARMVVRITGIGPGVTVPSDARQHVGPGGVVTIVMGTAPAPGQSFPELGPGFAKDLESDALIQADAPEIKRQAARIIGAERDRWQAALALYRWVYKNLKKKVVFSIPSALDVLESREGDCNEHTTLYVALARAVGIPARIAIGVVWSDAYHGFFYHAWPEVYAGRRWIAMDPTLGQPIADATHLKLLNGNIGQWPRLMAFIGKARLKVLDCQ